MYNPGHCTHLKTHCTCLEMFRTSWGEGLAVFRRMQGSCQDVVEVFISFPNEEQMQPGGVFPLAQSTSSTTEKQDGADNVIRSETLKASQGSQKKKTLSLCGLCFQLIKFTFYFCRAFSTTPSSVCDGFFPHSNAHFELVNGLKLDPVWSFIQYQLLWEIDVSIWKLHLKKLESSFCTLEDCGMFG